MCIFMYVHVYICTHTHTHAHTHTHTHTHSGYLDLLDGEVTLNLGTGKGHSVLEMVNAMKNASGPLAFPPPIFCMHMGGGVAEAPRLWGLGHFAK